MSINNNWPFTHSNQVHGMKLPDYLAWATGSGQKKLLLPPIQRGFVWKPKQIVDLWDSLLRGMPIGSLMISKLLQGHEGCDLITKDTKQVDSEALGLLDGQQRTLAMLIGYHGVSPSPHCLWIDLAENAHAGSPFEIRLTTRAQPFGFDRIAHTRLSRHERRKARERYDENHPLDKIKPDYELFESSDDKQPRPWKLDANENSFVRLKDVWKAFKDSKNIKSEFIYILRSWPQLTCADEKLISLYEAFERLEFLEVPLILVPDHICTPKSDSTSNDVSNAQDPLILLFERIGRNGASLSTEDLLFSMIKQQWPQAQDFVNQIHSQPSVGAFMGATDYVMTAFRLAAAEKHIGDNPRPTPNDLHRHLGELLGNKGETDRPLRNYLEEKKLASAFEFLFNTLSYREGMQDIGLPSLMMPHLSRGLIQVLLRWIMINSDQHNIEANRKKIISFSLFWYIHVWHEDKASKKSFEIIGFDQGPFPSEKLYNALIAAPEGELGLALPLMSGEDLENILDSNSSATIQSYDGIFKKDEPRARFVQSELYKRFCWWRKPILLWLQRAYVNRKFQELSLAQFTGLTDEDTVPYDYDHLCPQSHWGSDWRKTIKTADETSAAMTAFKTGRHVVGNCIGNLHVLESSLNRSFGDDALALKLKQEVEWGHEDSLLYHISDHNKLWETTSSESDEKEARTWNETRIQAFQSAVYNRAKGLYRQYYETCVQILA